MTRLLYGTAYEIWLDIEREESHQAAMRRHRERAVVMDRTAIDEARASSMLLEAHAARAQAIAQGLLGHSTHERMEAFASLVWLALDLKFPAWDEIRTRCWQLQVQREVEYAADASIRLRFVPSQQNLCALGASLAGVERTAESWYADPPQAPGTCRHCTCYLERVFDGD